MPFRLASLRSDRVPLVRALVVAMLSGLFTVVIILIVGRDYEARGGFVAQGGGTGGVQGLAMTLGLAQGSEWGQSPEFYQELLQTNEILGRVATTPIVLVGDTGRAQTLIERLRVSGSNPALQRERAIKKLRKNLSVSASRRTGIISFRLVLNSAPLVRAVAQMLLDEVARFDRETRRSKARAERDFVERRLGIVEQELTSAEDKLTAFVTKNRQPQASPLLMIEYERLQRSIQRHQLVFGTLSQAFEQARIDEVRDTPALTIVQRPEQPVLPTGRLLYYALAGSFLGLACFAGWTFRAKLRVVLTGLN